MSSIALQAALVQADTPQGEAVLALARELMNTIRIACALVEGRRTIDLSGLDGRIGLLCAQMLDLPPAEGSKLRPQLVALCAAADCLSQALAAHAPPSMHAVPGR